MKNNKSQGKIYIQELSFSVHDGKFFVCQSRKFLIDFINRNPKTLHALKTVVH